MRLGVALLALSQASSVLSFVQHLVAPQAFGSTNSRRNGNSASMVASIQTSSTVSSTKQGTNGAGQVQGSKGTAGVGTEAPAVEFDQQPGGLRTIEMYDTTLRDGTQMEGISASVNDKLKIALQLYNFGRFLGFGCHCCRVCWLMYHVMNHVRNHLLEAAVLAIAGGL